MSSTFFNFSWKSIINCCAFAILSGVAKFWKRKKERKGISSGNWLFSCQYHIHEYLIYTFGIFLSFFFGVCDGIYQIEKNVYQKNGCCCPAADGSWQWKAIECNTSTPKKKRTTRTFFFFLSLIPWLFIWINWKKKFQEQHRRETRAREQVDLKKKSEMLTWNCN
jgi:hypothetical protein